MFEWAVGLNVTWGSLKACGILIQMVVDLDVSEFSTLKAGFVVVSVVMGEGHVIVATGLPDFCASGRDLLFLG